MNIKKHLSLQSISMFFISLIVLSTGCHSDREKHIDVSHVIANSDIVRFDSLLYTIKNIKDLNDITKSYPIFSNLYFQQILKIPDAKRVDSLRYHIKNMLLAETFVELNDKIKSEYGHLNQIKDQWIEAMKHYKYYFDKNAVPDLYTCITEFSFGSFIFPLTADKDGIGVSLDMFLGSRVNYSLMAKVDPGFSSYNSRTFNQDHLVKKAVDALLDDLLPPVREPTFIYHLIREGKKYYASDKILPFVSDTVIWEYTPTQWQWTQNNEWNIYSFLIANDLIYSTQRSKYSRLLKASPHTSDMPPEAPGRAAIYVGFKIVEEYMRRHPNTTMSELFQADAKTIFQAAKYKPKRE